MRCVSLRLFVILCTISKVFSGGKCGCKVLTSCYMNMLELLHEQDEAYCIEDASIGSSTVTIYLRALREFCKDVVTVTAVATTFDERNLYEVIIQDKKELRTGENVPTIIIDAGQEGGRHAVKFALFIIEQLVACQENKEMTQNVKWVFMPSTNPDGLEYSRFKGNGWRKNLNVDVDGISFGVDISRNFDAHWGACPKVANGFAGNYPGPSAASEKETIFIKNVINKHKSDAKIYLSIREDGHHLAYPHAYSDANATNLDQLEMIVSEIAYKVNLRGGGVRSFKNNSIFNLEGKERCGHSVDWAAENGIKWPFEMRVFLETDSTIMSMFQTMPRGYENSLRNGYFTGIRELYNVLTNKKKYGKLE